MFEELKGKGFQVQTLHHAEAILTHDMPAAVHELESTLMQLQIPVKALIAGGGGEHTLTQWMRKTLSETHGWQKHCFEINKIVDGVVKESISHEIDHVKRFPAGTFALEIEWNNKDPFYDRDLENFKRLHAEGAVSVGAIITRGQSLQDGLRSAFASYAREMGLNEVALLSQFYDPTIRQKRLFERAASRLGSFEDGWAHVFVKDKFGEATTHWRKLEARIQRGVGSPCPLVLIGIPLDCLTSDEGDLNSFLDTEIIDDVDSGLPACS